jgi:hypothetical protein
MSALCIFLIIFVFFKVRVGLWEITNRLRNDVTYFNFFVLSIGDWLPTVRKESW